MRILKAIISLTTAIPIILVDDVIDVAVVINSSFFHIQEDVRNFVRGR